MFLISLIKELVVSKGYELMVVGNFPHKDDDFIKCLIAKNKKEFVCWIYNVNDNALYDGYYTSSYEDAFEKYVKRLS